MKLGELSENWVKQKLLHAFGKVSAEDIVNGAEFSLKSADTHIIRIVDELNDKARYVYVLDNGNLYDPGNVEDFERLDFAKLYDGDPTIGAKLKKRAKKPAANLKREFKTNIARFINDNDGKKIT